MNRRGNYNKNITNINKDASFIKGYAFPIEDHASLAPEKRFLKLCT